MAVRLHVGNLSYDTKDQALYDFFSTAGIISSADVITERGSGRSKGFGFVEVADADMAQAIMTLLDGAELDGREITVSIARAKGGASGGGGRSAGPKREPVDRDRRRY